MVGRVSSVLVELDACIHALRRTSRILHYTGILTLGVGDAIVRRFRISASTPQALQLTTVAQASIVGKKLGRYKWSPTTPKTLEGSIAFTLSIVICACLLRLLGCAERFPVSATY